MINDFYTNKTIISLAAVLWSVKQHTLPLLGGREQGALCCIQPNGYEEDYLNWGFARGHSFFSILFYVQSLRSCRW